MQILGRTVEAIQYENQPLITAYVNQKPDDCRRDKEPDYQCINNCEGKLVIARFLEKNPISIKALVPVELDVHPQIIALRDVKDLEGLEAVAKQEGYELKDVNKGKMLYSHNQPVASYNPCGLAMDERLFSQEVTETIRQLIIRVDELYEIAESKPLEAVLEDSAVANQLSNPILKQAMAQLCGQEGIELLAKLRREQTKRD